MPSRARAASAMSPNAKRKDSSNTAGSQGQGAAGRAPTAGSSATPSRARSVGRGVTERQTRGSDDTTSRRSMPASAAISEAGRTTTTSSTRNSRRSSVTIRDGDRRRSTSQPEATTTAASSQREGRPRRAKNFATTAAATSGASTSSTSTSATVTSGTTTSATVTSGTTTSATVNPGTTTSATETSGTTTSAIATSGTTTSATETSGTATSGTATSGTAASGTATSGTTTSGTPTTSASRAERPHSGAPPTYAESVNHLTLEYGGYFVPYESRPIATPLPSNVSNLSYSQMNLAGRGASGHRSSRNSVSRSSVGPIGVPADRRLIDERNPRGRRQRRVGDLALTASERVVITEPVRRELEEPEDEDNGSFTKLLLPPMHICMATTCLVFNCVIPGSGTLVAAFGLFCCTKSDEWSCGRKMASSCLCLLVALAQIILTPVLLIGWIWSILWGFAYVGVSHQEYHGIKDDDDDEEEDELATITSARGRGGMDDLEDDDTWALGYRRFDHPTSAPSQRRMSIAGTGSQVDLEQRRHASMLRATRSYGYVEVHGLQGPPYGSIDHHRLARTRLQRPPGSDGSSNTLNSNRPMSQTTLTSYINDGMFLNNPPPPPQPTRTHPPSMVTIDM